MHMRLQIAIDHAHSSNIFDTVDKIADVIDIVEIGTPMVMNEGMKAVRMVKEKYPDLTVLADTKIVDGGALECRYAVEAGADIITVLAMSEDRTIRDVADTAHKSGRKVMADLIGITDIKTRAEELTELGVDYIAVHTPFDVQETGRTPYEDLVELLEVVPRRMCAVAGGVKQSTVAEYAALHPAIIIAGGALYNASDVRQAVIDMKAVITAEGGE